MTLPKNILDPAEPLRLLRLCPEYKRTPLVQRDLRGASLWLKDETNRMGLGSFKGLGGVYAVAQLIAREVGGDLACETLLCDQARAVASTMTFVCASAGNHGLAVASGARIFGARCRIHLPATVPAEFVARLEGKGAEVVSSGSMYEESMAIAAEDAGSSDAILLADSSWPSYTEPARLVMEGYTVMAEEMREHFNALGKWPSHVYLQAGVGGLAAAVAYMIRHTWATQPEIIVVEPAAASCLKRSFEANAIVTADGPVSNMGRLDCKIPSILAFEILRKTADRFVTVTDKQASEATAAAAELGLETTPSGAAGLAAALVMGDASANPLVVITEGNVVND